MDDMCTACLCIGRNLYFIGETGHYHLYSQILNEIPVYDFSDVCVRVCWECRAMLRRFGEFKTLVKRSYTKLLRQLHHSDPPKKCSLICSPHLQIQNVIDISYPDIQVKEEDTLEDHNFISERADKYHNLEEPLSVDEVKVEDSDIYGNNKSDIYVNNKEARETRKSKKTLKEKIKKVKKKKKVLPRTVKKHNKGEQNIQENSSESVIDERTSDGVTTTVNDDVFMMVMCSEDNLEDKDEKFNVINSDADDIECTVQEKEIPIVKNPLSKRNLIHRTHGQLKTVIDTSCLNQSVKEEKRVEDHEYVSKSTERNQIIEEPLSDDEVKISDLRVTRKSKTVKVKKKKLPLRSNKKKEEDTKKTPEVPMESLNNEASSDCDNDEAFAENNVAQNEEEYNVNNIEENGEEYNVINSNTECTAQRKAVAVVRVAKGMANGIKVDGDLPKQSDEKPKCNECGKMFSSKKTFRYHLNTIHKGQNCFPCPRCGKVYQWKSNLGRHMRTHKALDTGELHCVPCDKWFASVATYRQHLRMSRTHVGENDYSFSCAECGKRFLDKRRLREHVDWEHLQKVRFRCQLCHKAYKSHTSLYVHMQNLHRDKKKDNLCHICGKSYQNAAKLKYHIVAMHTSETPYTCGQCGAAFGWYSSLYRHTREVHHKIKLQPKKSRKQKRDMLPSMLPTHDMMLPHQPGPA